MPGPPRGSVWKHAQTSNEIPCWVAFVTRRIGAFGPHSRKVHRRTGDRSQLIDPYCIGSSAGGLQPPGGENFDARDAWPVHDGIGSLQGYYSRSVTTCGCATVVCGGFCSNSGVGETIRTRYGSGAAESYNLLSGWFRRFPTKIGPSDAAQLTKGAYCAIAHLAMVTDPQVPPFSGQSEAMAIHLHRPVSW